MVLTCHNTKGNVKLVQSISKRTEDKAHSSNNAPNKGDFSATIQIDQDAS